LRLRNVVFGPACVGADSRYNGAANFDLKVGRTA